MLPLNPIALVAAFITGYLLGRAVGIVIAESDPEEEWHNLYPDEEWNAGVAEYWETLAARKARLQ